MKVSEVVLSYVTHKQAMGHRFRTEEAVLKSFCKAIGNGPIATINAEIVLAFLNSSDSITEFWVKKYHVLSGLYRFALARELVQSSPLPRSIPNLTVPPFVPYIYSHQELKHLLAVVPDVCGNRTPVEGDVFRTVLLVLYGAGLRIGEALALTSDDVNLRQACLHIRETKFFKSRLVPLGKDLNGILTDYITRCNERHIPPTDTPLFCFSDGSPLSQSAMRSAFRRLRSCAGVMREGGSRRQPCLHDLRHTAAVHRLISWYHSGLDLQDLLPKLATYLGHVDLSSTQRYLTLTPELYRLASLRFEDYANGGQS